MSVTTSPKHTNLLRKLTSVLVMLLVVGGVHAQVNNTKDQAPKARPGKGRSQIVDDSTKNVYGPTTSRWTTEQSIFTGKKKYVPIDTLILNYHRWTFVQKANNFYKDLGNVGTALSPIFPTLPTGIGVTPGFTAYDPYYFADGLHYYDTKSPYTRIYVVWGGNGRAMTKVEFSRNINARWNFGFDYRPILADKQIQYKKADRQTVSHSYDFYTTYKGKDDRYFLLFDYKRMRHRVFENGGVNPGSVSDFFDKDVAVFLGHAITEQRKSNLHLFQQYQLAKPAQIYLISDYSVQLNKFTDSTDPITYFDYTQGDTAHADDHTHFEVYMNEAGFKGNAGPLFYNFYAKNRAYSFTDSYYTSQGELQVYKKTGTERYIGGRVGLTFDSLTEFTGSAEYLLDGNYKLEATWKSPWIDAWGSTSLSKPGLMQQFYFGSHDAWSNSFSNTSMVQLGGFLKGKFGRLLVSPGATFTTASNYIFFREKVDSNRYQQVLPFQSSGLQAVFSPELRLNVPLGKHWSIRPQFIYTVMLKNADNAFHIPSSFLNAQFSYENALFKGNLIVHTGFDFHWKSAYNALAYDPAIQSFYIQDTASPKYFTSPDFLLADVFFNAKLKRGKFFLKYHNIVQAFSGKGYVPTPGYQGQHSVMDFGFELLLFD